jgi:hypothetical protein
MLGIMYLVCHFTALMLQGRCKSDYASEKSVNVATLTH